MAVVSAAPVLCLGVAEEYASFGFFLETTSRHSTFGALLGSAMDI